MSLDETQKQTVRDWIQSGEDLSEIQSKLASELGVSLTYMEVAIMMVVQPAGEGAKAKEAGSITIRVPVYKQTRAIRAGEARG